jgi:hypothetical protein
VLDLCGIFAAVERGVKARRIESQIGRVLFQRGHVERRLILEEQGDVLEEFALCV